jgi:hypothetical protein
MRRDRVVQNSSAALAAVAVFGWAGAARAGEVSITHFLADGTHSATATFVFNDDGPTTTLDILLVNTMSVTGEGTNPQWLQGLFFDIAGSPVLSYLGLGGDGSDAYNDMVIVHDGGMGPDTYTAYNTVSVDHFWALDQNISGGLLPFGSQQYGLGAAGFGVFSSTEVLNLQAGGPLPQLDGSDGGILSGDLLANGTLDLPGGHTEREMVDGGIWLSFDLGDYDVEDASVDNVNFVFGTSFGEVVLIPVPAALPLGLAGLVGLVVGRRRIGRAMTR